MYVNILYDSVNIFRGENARCRLQFDIFVSDTLDTFHTFIDAIVIHVYVYFYISHNTFNETCCKYTYMKNENKFFCSRFTNRFFTRNCALYIRFSK